MKILIKPNLSKKHYLLAADKVQLHLNSFSGWQFILFPLEGSKVDHWVTDFTDEEAKKVCFHFHSAQIADFFDHAFPMRGMIGCYYGKQKFILSDLKIESLVEK